MYQRKKLINSIDLNMDTLSLKCAWYTANPMHAIVHRPTFMNYTDMHSMLH